MTKAVIFDMFETLVSLFQGHTYFSEDIAADVGADSQIFRRVWHETEHDRSTGKMTIEEGIEETLRKLGIFTEEKAEKAIAKRLSALKESFDPIPEDSICLLKSLRDRGIKIGLISNTFSDEAEVIRNSALFPYFDAVRISYEQGICKPDPRLYHSMIQELGVSAAECLYVGDGGSKELFAAREAGMHAVQAAWFRDMAFEPHIPCRELPDFPQAMHQLDIFDYLS